MKPDNYYWIALFTLIISAKVQAQQTTTDNSYYFDDNNISTSRNVIKTDVGALFHKEASLLWEHALSKKVTFEAGTGILLPPYIHSYIGNWIDFQSYRAIEKPGISFSLQSRYYYSEALKLNYVSVGIKHRHFSTINTTDYYTGVGKQYHIGNRIKLDISFNLSIRHQRSLDGQTYLFDEDSDISFAVPIMLKLGYLL